MIQTAIEWLIEYCDREIGYIPNNIIKQAKAMEKEQIMDAYETSHISMMTSEQYYNEIFKQQENEL